MELNKVEENDEGESKKGYDEYELRNYCDILLQAEEIKADSKKMAALKPYLKAKAKAIGSIAELRQVVSDKNNEKSTEA